jgi:hypothetical protein
MPRSNPPWSLPAVRPGRSALCAAAAGLFLLAAAHPAQAIVFQDAVAQAAGLGAGQAFLAPEARLIVTLSNNSQSGCSGSLLAGGQYVLTAAHCVTGDTNTLSATNILLTFAHTGLALTATNYLVDPVWNGSIASGGDLALIRLDTAVTTIAGYPIYAASSVVGSTVTLAGYGLTGVGSTGYVAGTFGTLYYGANQYDGVYGNAPSVYGFDLDKNGSTAFNTFGGDAVGSDEVMIAPGDSGGGSLLDIDGIWWLVGVHDFISCLAPGCTANSSFGQIGGDTSLFANADWLYSVLPEPPTAPLLLAGLLGLAAVARRRQDDRPPPQR